MAQLDRAHKHGDSPKSPGSRTMEQLLRGGDGSSSTLWTSPTPSGALSNSSSPRKHHHDQEEDHPHQPKKSVLTKVKEKAKKLKHSLSGKKKHSTDENSTPSWGVSLEDEEGEEEDAEYLGAPMYESELAPEGYKETLRQHPRAIHVISEKHALDDKQTKPCSPNKEETSKSLSPKDNKTTQPEIVAYQKSSSPLKTTKEEPMAARKPHSPQKKLTESMSQKYFTPAYETMSGKLGPAYASVADATHSIASKIQGLSLSSPTASQTNSVPQTFSAPLAQPPSLAATTEAPTSFSGPVVAPPTETGKCVSSVDEQMWDKGVSVKEYLMQKFEPGDDEKALSRAISDVVSPRRTTTSDISVLEKVREAVTSLLRNDLERSKPALTRSATNSSNRIPVSTNAQEVGEEENHGRVLQTN